MKLTYAKNGFILEDQTGQIIYQDSSYEENDIERFADFLGYLNEALGPTTSRYSKQRIYIRIEPGDKYEEKE